MLESVTLSDMLTEFGSECFKNCSSLTSLVLPASMYHIQDGVFDGCGKIRRIECNAPVPPTVERYPFANEVIYSATLCVQGKSLLSYQYDSFWGRFGYWEESGNRITDLILNRELALDGDTRFDRLHLTVNPGASFAIEGDAMQEFKSVALVAGAGGCGTFVSNSSAVVSEKTKVVYEMEGNKWCYVALPFDANLSDIEMNDEYVRLAMYEYDGEARAAGVESGAWKRVTGGTMKAGKGYIIQADGAVKLIFNATHVTVNDAFMPYAVSVPLVAWPSATGPSETGWNFVGNPYPAYFDIRYMDIMAPITVWNGYTYTAYSVPDDKLVLSPLQPFFVQCPAGVDRITFNMAGRQTSPTVTGRDAAVAAQRVGAPSRYIVNLVLAGSDGNEVDRTRVVVNAEASDAYEISCDAAKMMSTDTAVPQIWTWSGNTVYAINEGPQSGGRVALGMYIPADGEYRLSAPRADIAVTLCDNVTGREVTLFDGETYTFEAMAGRLTERFTLVMTGGTDGIGTTAAGAELYGSITYYTADGRVAGTDKSMLKPGLYIKKNKGKTTKIIVR